MRPMEDLDMLKFTPQRRALALLSITFTSAALCAAPVSAQTSPKAMGNTTTGMTLQTINGYTPSARQAPIAAFVPQAATSRTRLDYSLYSDALDNSVLKLGMSTRNRASRPQLSTGSRFVRGHRSAYRLEGSRVSFSFLNEEYKGAMREYTNDLQAIGSQIDLTRLSRNEQLAYWLNLHNVALITEIAEQYPVRRPSKMKVDGVPLHDAKILNIKGVPLSLRDIRERIVYPNWANPNVIYGFFYGDVGSPGLEYEAFTAANVGRMLNEQGREFVNSLRGFNEGSKTRNVSRIYAEAQPFYFPNWESDLTAHLSRKATDEVRAELLSNKPFKIEPYDDVIADLMGGDRPRIATGQVVDADELAGIKFGGSSKIPAEVVRLLQEFDNKRQTLRRRGQLQTGGIVIIEDIDTTEPSYDPNIDPESEVYVPPK